MQRALASVLFLATLPLLAQDSALLRHFDYDPKGSIDIQEVGVEVAGGHAPPGVYDPIQRG